MSDPAPPLSKFEKALFEAMVSAGIVQPGYLTEAVRRWLAERGPAPGQKWCSIVPSPHNSGGDSGKVLRLEWTGERDHGWAVYLKDEKGFLRVVEFKPFIARWIKVSAGCPGEHGSCPAAGRGRSATLTPEEMERAVEAINGPAQASPAMDRARGRRPSTECGGVDDPMSQTNE